MVDFSGKVMRIGGDCRIFELFNGPDTGLDAVRDFLDEELLE